MSGFMLCPSNSDKLVTGELVWVPLRNGRSRVWHDRPECMTRLNVGAGAIPTLRPYVEALGFRRCLVCERQERRAARRAVVTGLREQCLTVP